jgi:biopolymer transport protein ExbB/TolQ
MGGEDLNFFQSLAKAFQDGGIGMYPIAFMSAFSLAVLADRIYALYFRDNVNKEAFMRGLKKFIYAGDLDKAISYVSNQKKTPLTSVVKSGLINVPKGEDEVQAAMDEAALRENPKIEKRTGYLAMIGNVSTLFGLFGTIVGLIKCFGAVAQVDPATKATVLSLGISEAMNCTAFGLLVAIPSLLAYSVLQGRSQHMLDDINEVSVGLLNLIIANKDKMKMPANLPAEE